MLLNKCQIIDLLINAPRIWRNHEAGTIDFLEAVHFFAEPLSIIDQAAVRHGAPYFVTLFSANFICQGEIVVLIG